jgi:hypothetical protein
VQPETEQGRLLAIFLGAVFETYQCDYHRSRRSVIADRYGLSLDDLSLTLLHYALLAVVVVSARGADLDCRRVRVGTRLGAPRKCV